MYKRILTTSVLILGMAAVAPPDAQAQVACAPRDAIVDVLTRIHGEMRTGGGLAGPTAIFEVWTSQSTGSWTILKTLPNGLTCIMATGDNWNNDSRVFSPVGDPA